MCSKKYQQQNFWKAKMSASMEVPEAENSLQYLREKMQF